MNNGWEVREGMISKLSVIGSSLSCDMITAAAPTRPESIMLQKLPIMLFGIAPIFCLLC